MPDNKYEIILVTNEECDNLERYQHMTPDNIEHKRLAKPYYDEIMRATSSLGVTTTTMEDYEQAQRALDHPPPFVPFYISKYSQ